MKERRCRMLLLETDTILAILRGQISIVDFDVPADAHVVAVDWDYSRFGFAIAIESAQFDPVPLGTMFPLLPPFQLRKG